MGKSEVINKVNSLIDHWQVTSSARELKSSIIRTIFLHTFTMLFMEGSMLVVVIVAVTFLSTSLSFMTD